MDHYESAIAGAAAGGTAGVFTNPIDVLKTNYMADKTGMFKSYLHCFRFLLKEEGPRVFLRGMMYRLVHVSSMSVVFFMAYEQFLNWSIGFTAK